MKNSVEDAFHHLTPGRESRGAATTCYAACEKKDRLSTFETAPGTRKKKSIYSTVSLAGGATRTITGAASPQRNCEQQTAAFEPYSLQL